MDTFKEKLNLLWGEVLVPVYLGEIEQVAVAFRNGDFDHLTSRPDNDLMTELVYVFTAEPEWLQSFTHWDWFEARDWAQLLSKQPQFASRFDKWNELEPHDWVVLLSDQPQFASRFDKWNELSSSDWVELLGRQPQFADKVSDWKGLSSFWHLIVSEQPQLYPYFDQRVMKLLLGWAWGFVLQQQPQLEPHCPWELFTESDWNSFTDKCSRFVEKLKLEVLHAEAWSKLLPEHPELADRCCLWDEFSISYWSSLMAAQPQFISKYEEYHKWSELSGSDWARVLSSQPTLSGECDKVNGWLKMNGRNWSNLLIHQPQFSPRCDKWHELNGINWASLLHYQPQFAEKRPPENTESIAEYLRTMPYEKVPRPGRSERLTRILERIENEKEDAKPEQDCE